MIRQQLPKGKYNGITLVLSNPSRFDLTNNELLSIKAGYFIDGECLWPEYRLMNCEIRTCDCLAKLLPDTKGVILFGEKSFYSWGDQEYEGYLLQEQRGYLIENKIDPSIPTIATWTPQDCLDQVDHESRFNREILQDKYLEKLRNIKKRIRLTKEEESDDKRHHGATSRKNYKFWVTRDIKKLKEIIADKSSGGPPPSKLTVVPVRAEEFDTHHYQSEQCHVENLTTIKNKHVFLDIETDSEWNMRCFSYGYDREIYCVPIVRYNYSTAYTNVVRILAALNICFRDNIIICHNAMFDLFILAWKYGMIIGNRNEDTMLMHHRIFVEKEKSLGHCLSHLTLYETFHKDEGIFSPKNAEQEKQLWKYNAKDVAATMLIYWKMKDLIKKDPGLIASVQQANEMILPFLVMQLQGMKFNETGRITKMKENDRLMMHYLRVLKLLIGREFLPTSNKQCTQYFQKEMNYPIVRKSEKTGLPSWNEEAQQELRLKYPNNPVLNFCLMYRQRGKETGTLKFEPWMKVENEKI